MSAVVAGAQLQARTLGCKAQEELLTAHLFGISGLYVHYGNSWSFVAACAQLQARTLGCKAPDELSTAFPEWAGCNFIPENLHPKSFRGYIGHNTNVWAAANRAGIKVRSL